MGFSGVDILIIAIFVFAIVLIGTFYSESGTYISMNNNFSILSYSNKSICDELNCSDIERYAKTVVSTTSTTTTTLKIYLFNTSGATSSLVKTNYGDIQQTINFQ